MSKCRIHWGPDSTNVPFDLRLPVAEFRHLPAAPIIAGNDRNFRTRIREGAEKGPNFSGHYTVVEWGCGTGCVVFVVIDAASGRVYHAMPFDSLSVPYEGTADGRVYKGPVYRLDSSLLIADGCPEDLHSAKPNWQDACGTHYYKWERGRFVLITSVTVRPATLKK